MFLYLAHQAVHVGNAPMKSHPEYALDQAPARYIAPYAWVADEARRNLSAMVTALDESVHNVTRALRASGMVRPPPVPRGLLRPCDPFTSYAQARLTQRLHEQPSRSGTGRSSSSPRTTAAQRARAPPTFRSGAAKGRAGEWFAVGEQ